MIPGHLLLYILFFYVFLDVCFVADWLEMVMDGAVGSKAGDDTEQNGDTQGANAKPFSLREGGGGAGHCWCWAHMNSVQNLCWLKIIVDYTTRSNILGIVISDNDNPIEGSP